MRRCAAWASTCRAGRRRDRRDGQPIVGDSLLLLLNAQDEAVDFRLPRPLQARPWTLVLDTADMAQADVECPTASHGSSAGPWRS